MEVSFIVLREMFGAPACAISCPPKKCQTYLFTVAFFSCKIQKNTSEKKVSRQKKQTPSISSLLFVVASSTSETNIQKISVVVSKRRPKGRFRSDSKKNENLGTAAIVCSGAKFTPKEQQKG